MRKSTLFYYKIKRRIKARGSNFKRVPAINMIAHLRKANTEKVCQQNTECVCGLNYVYRYRQTFSRKSLAVLGYKKKLSRNGRGVFFFRYNFCNDCQCNEEF